MQQTKYQILPMTEEYAKQISHWTYWLCIFLSGMSVGYFFIYIPKFIEIKNYLTDLMKDYETEK